MGRGESASVLGAACDVTYWFEIVCSGVRTIMGYWGRRLGCESRGERSEMSVCERSITLSLVGD
jgi:hypothetical protein